MSRVEQLTPVLSILGATKTYGTVRALSDVTLTVQPGEVHGLIGQNGAGKSTLMGVASGAFAPDSGQVLIDGHLCIGNPSGARQLGLAMVRQEPALMFDLTVAENLYLGVPEKLRPRIGELKPWTRQLLRQWSHDIAIDPSMRVNVLTSEQRFIVDIVRALAAHPRILVLDEPTEHLQGSDVDRLFECVAQVTAKGAGVIYISHRIREVRRIADRVTVLRDGQSQGTFDTAGLSEQQIIELIVGSSVSAEFPEKSKLLADMPILNVCAYRGKGVNGVSMQLFPGEIVGLAGVDGNGQREFLRSLGGLHSGVGDITVDGQSVTLNHPDQAARVGIQFISNDRHGESVFSELPITSNFSLRSIWKDAKGGFVSSKAESRRAVDSLMGMTVKLGSVQDPISSLSGGNQQKLVLGGALAADPIILLVDEPTQGVDIGSRLEIYRILRSTVANGKAAVVLSSDANELAGLCDRILVFSRGSIAAELRDDQVTEAGIISEMLMATNSRQLAHSSKPQAPCGSGSMIRMLATDWAPLLMISVVVALLGTLTAFNNENYLSASNFAGMLALVATLAMVACAQQALMLVGGIDLSVGPLMGLIVVSQSFMVSGPWSGLGVFGGLAVLVAIALLVGTFNWILVEPVGLHPMVATLATFMALQGVSLVLRPTSDGLINDTVMESINTSLGFVPITFLLVVAVSLILDYGLFKRYTGISVRGMGSNPHSARLAGISPARTRLLAYLSCSLMAGLASIPLLGQVGVGDPRAGIDYTLLSIAAVVIGGGSLFGARGSFVGALLGAVLIAQVNVATTFLGLGEAWQAYLLGALIIAAVAVHSKSRQLVLAR